MQIGAHVVTLALDEKIVVPSKRKGMLPVLIVLFLISYGLMSTLVVEQGRTIESQRGLIRDLFSDSTELSALKMKEVLRERGMVAPPVKAGEQTMAAPAQEAPEQAARNKGSARSQRPALQKPPKPTADTADSRRIPLTI